MVRAAFPASLAAPLLCYPPLTPPLLSLLCATSVPSAASSVGVSVSLYLRSSPLHPSSPLRFPYPASRHARTTQRLSQEVSTFTPPAHQPTLTPSPPTDTPSPSTPLSAVSPTLPPPSSSTPSCPLRRGVYWVVLSLVLTVPGLLYLHSYSDALVEEGSVYSALSRKHGLGKQAFSMAAAQQARERKERMMKEKPGKEPQPKEE